MLPSTLTIVVTAVFAFVVIGGIIVALNCYDRAPASPPTPTPVATPIEITAEELLSAYQANEIAADAEYKNKIVRVTGVVDSVGKDILGTPYVTLSSGGIYEITGVQCLFAKKHEDELIPLTKGQTVTIQGRVDGYLFHVLVKDCLLIH